MKPAIYVFRTFSALLEALLRMSLPAALYIGLVTLVLLGVTEFLSFPGPDDGFLLRLPTSVGIWFGGWLKFFAVLILFGLGGLVFIGRTEHVLLLGTFDDVTEERRVQMARGLLCGLAFFVFPAMGYYSLKDSLIVGLGGSIANAVIYGFIPAATAIRLKRAACGEWMAWAFE